MAPKALTNHLWNHRRRATPTFSSFLFLCSATLHCNCTGRLNWVAPHWNISMDHTCRQDNFWFRSEKSNLKKSFCKILGANDIFAWKRADSTMEQNVKLPKLKSATAAMVDKSPKIPQIYSRLPKGIENGNFCREWKGGNFGGGKLRQFWQGERGRDCAARGWEHSDLLPTLASACFDDLTNIGNAWQNQKGINAKRFMKFAKPD